MFFCGTIYLVSENWFGFAIPAEAPWGFDSLLMPAERYPASPTSAQLITTGHWRICGGNEIFDEGQIDGFSFKMVESVRRMLEFALGILWISAKMRQDEAIVAKYLMN